MALIAGCAEQREEFTWGDAAALYVGAACAAADRCGRDFDVGKCLQDSYEAMAGDVEDEPVPELVEHYAEACAYAFDQYDENACNLFWEWGAQPSVCFDLLYLKPGLYGDA